jgi:serine/threonine protein kinase
MIPKKNIAVHAEIDNGSFGSILKASIGGKAVVLKRIEQENGSDHFSELISPIHFELQAVSVLKHPNIVGFEGMMMDIPVDGSVGKPVASGFVFELCELGNVFSHIFGLKRRLGYWGDRLRVSCEVAVGMAYIHDSHFIHRDLNSQNVVLTPDLRAKICDFGTARFLGPSGRFQPTHIEGSPCAMSPEQFTGQVLTLRSDVWQMGVFLWEIFAMRRPWSEVCPAALAFSPPRFPLPFHRRFCRRLPSFPTCLLLSQPFLLSSRQYERRALASRSLSRA